jgi:hypothetical protein
MSDKTINGENTDTYVKDHLISIARDLSPVRDNDGRLAYASLLLSWILQGETPDLRFARTKSINQAYRNRVSDFGNGIKTGPDMTISYPDFVVEAEKFLEFLS